MSVLQSPCSGEAEPPPIDQRSVVGMSSPGGEETGEGELYCSGRKPALIDVSRCHKARCLRAVLPYSFYLNLCVSVPRWLNSPFWILSPANPKPKSTLGYPKSTVDLGLDLLIWVKNGLPTLLLPALRHSFCLITTRNYGMPAKCKPILAKNETRARL
jgi:hypothetical protein